MKKYGKKNKKGIKKCLDNIVELIFKKKQLFEINIYYCII